MKTKAISDLLDRIQPLMDNIDPSDMSQKLSGAIDWIGQMTNVTTPDYAQRLLILNEQGVINGDEYVDLIFHFTTPASDLVLKDSSEGLHSALTHR